MILLKPKILILLGICSFYNACSRKIASPYSSSTTTTDTGTFEDMDTEFSFSVTGVKQSNIMVAHPTYGFPNIPKTISVHEGFLSDVIIQKRLLMPAVQTKTNTGELDYSTNIKPFCTPGSGNCIDLGMPKVRVFDQGTDGTCITFATTAAVNVLLQKGDYISQQCLLELGIATKYGNFWNGAHTPIPIINLLNNYGIVRQGTCNAEYPNTSAQIPLQTYSTLVSMYGLSEFNINYVYTSKITQSVDMLSVVKTALNHGRRVLVGFGLLDTLDDPISIQGFNIMMDDESKTGGLWACMQPGIYKNYCKNINVGHEAIIIGYDDNQQLLKIRNSWGTTVGDNGNFYMTYTFFNAMSFHITQIY